MSSASGPESRLSRTLETLCAWTTRHPYWVLGVCAITLGISLWLSMSRLQYRTQRDDLMSADKTCQVRWRAYLQEFGADDDIVFAIEGGDRARMQSAVEALAADLQSSPQLFDRVFHRVDLRSVQDRALLYLSEDELQKIEAHLRELGPLLGPGAAVAWRGLTLQNLMARAESILARRQRGESPNASDRAFLRQFTTILSSAAKTLRDPRDFVNPWNAIAGPSRDDENALAQPRYFFSDDGTLAFLLARPANPDRQSFTPAAEAVGEARNIAARARQRFPDLQFGITGLPVLEHDEMDGTDRDSMRAAWLALAAVAVLFVFVYRGFRYPLMTVASLLTGTIWALGLTAVTIGHLNILSSAFAVMLIGIGDYGVLWVARFDEERKAGRDFDRAIRHTAACAGPSIVAAALSTSLAFYATMFADFQAVSELGFIAGSGVLLCAFACLVLIPAMQGLLQRWKPAKSQGLPIVWPASANAPRAWLPALNHRPKTVLGVTALLLIAGLALAVGTRYDDNLLHLQTANLESVCWETKLLDRTKGAGWSALSIADTPEEAIALRGKYEELAEVAHAEEIGSLIPANQDRKLPALERMAALLKWLPSREQAADRQPVTEDSTEENVARLLSLAQSESDLFVALQAFQDALALSDRQARMGAFNRRLAQSLWNELDHLRHFSSPRSIGLDDLPRELRERFIGSTGKWLVRAYAKHDIWDHDAMQQFVAQTRTVDPNATGKPFGTLEGLHALRNGFFWAGLYALLAIAAVLVVDFRSGRDVLLGLLPLVLGAIASLAIMRLFGITLNPANLIALPLIVGVGVDNGVHVLHDHRAKPPGEPYRMSAGTGRGICVAALTTILGFGTLMISRHQGMHSLGLILALGVTCCMVAALAILPAVLSMLERGIQSGAREFSASNRIAA